MSDSGRRQVDEDQAVGLDFSLHANPSRYFQVSLTFFVHVQFSLQADVEKSFLYFSAFFLAHTSAAQLPIVKICLHPEAQEERGNAI